MCCAWFQLVAQVLILQYVLMTFDTHANPQGWTTLYVPKHGKCKKYAKKIYTKHVISWKMFW